MNGQVMNWSKEMREAYNAGVGHGNRGVTGSCPNDFADYYEQGKRDGELFRRTREEKGMRKPGGQPSEIKWLLYRTSNEINTTKPQKDFTKSRWYAVMIFILGLLGLVIVKGLFGHH